MAEPLSQQTLKNTLYSLAGYVVPIVISLFVTPIIVKKLGLAEYGVYTLLNTLIAFLSVLDFGLHIAVIKYVSEYVSRQEYDAVAKLLSTARSAFFGVGIFGLIIFIALGKLSAPVFNLTINLDGQLFFAFVLSGLYFFITSVGWVYVACLPALQRYDIYTKLNVLQLIILNGLVVLAVIAGYKLTAVYAITVGVAISVVGAYRFYVKKLLPEVLIRYEWSWQELRKCYQFGFIAALSNFSTNALIQLDKLIIPSFLGAQVLPYYSLPGNIAQKTAGITGSLSAVVFPLSSSLAARGATAQNEILYRRMMRVLAVVAAGCSMVIILFAEQILLYWLGGDFAEQGTRILQILSGVYFLLALYGPLTNFLLGTGRVGYLVSWSAGMALLNLAALLLLVPRFGILGAAWAFVIGVAPIPIMFLVTEKYILRLSGIARFYLALYAKIGAVSVVFWFIARFALVDLVGSLWTLLAVGLLAIVLYFGIYVLLGFVEEEDWLIAQGFVNRFRKQRSI